MNNYGKTQLQEHRISQFKTLKAISTKDVTENNNRLRVQREAKTKTETKVCPAFDSTLLTLSFVLSWVANKMCRFACQSVFWPMMTNPVIITSRFRFRNLSRRRSFRPSFRPSRRLRFASQLWKLMTSHKWMELKEIRLVKLLHLYRRCIQYIMATLPFSGGLRMNVWLNELRNGWCYRPFVAVLISQSITVRDRWL